MQPGDLYLAVGGAATHGANFAAQAAAAGAAVMVTDEAGAAILAADGRDPGLPVVVVAGDPRPAAGALAAAVYGRPSAGLTVVGITGTNGKTTMSFMIAAALRAAGERVGVIGTTGIYLEDERLPAERTTPEAVELHAILAHIKERGITAVVMEVSSHAIVFGRVGGVEFDAGVFTNLTQDHLDFHGTMDAYFAAKASFIDTVPCAIVCVDDEWGRVLAARLPAAQTYAVGADVPATWFADGMEISGDGMDFRLHGPAAVASELTAGVPAHVGLIGDFNVANATGTAATVCSLGSTWPPPRPASGTAREFPGGCSRSVMTLGCGPSWTTRTPPTPWPAPSLPRPAGARGGGLRRRPGCGQTAPHGWGRSAPRGLRRHYRRQSSFGGSGGHSRCHVGRVSAVPASERAQVVEVADRRAAIRVAVAEARPGDSVLVLGKGHEQGQTVGATVHPFDDVTELARHGRHGAAADTAQAAER